MTLPYAILELFLHNLKKSIMNLEKTAAFSVARRGPGRFLSFPLLFPHFLLSVFQTPLSVPLLSLKPHKLLSHQHTVPHCFSLLFTGGICWEGRKTKLPVFCFPAHLPGALLILSCSGVCPTRSSSRARGDLASTTFSNI